LFSLTNKDSQPSKIRQTNRNCSIYCASRFGPTFGDFFDIYICDSANTTENNFSNLGYSYEHPQPSQCESYLAGSEYFLLSEIEVNEKTFYFIYYLVFHYALFVNSLTFDLINYIACNKPYIKITQYEKISFYDLNRILRMCLEDGIPLTDNGDSVDGKRKTERLLKDGISVKTSKKRNFFLKDGNSKKYMSFLNLYKMLSLMNIDKNLNNYFFSKNLCTVCM
jgi:hypothetical protein